MAKARYLVEAHLDTTAARRRFAHHLAREGIDGVPSVSTIWRILRREGWWCLSRKSARAPR